MRLPIARIAETLAEVNRSRDEKDRVLLIVDGVHGFGVEDPKITALGCDAFAAGTHKWLFGPRGTGFVWAKPAVWQRMRPVIPSFSSPDLFAAWGRNMSRRLRRERHGFHRAVSKRSNIFGHYRKRFGFIKTSARRESPREHTSSTLK